MRSEMDWNKLARYLAGESSREEQQDIEDRMTSDPEFQALVSHLRAIWELRAEEKYPWQVDAAWTRFLQKTRLSTLSKIRKKSRKYARSDLARRAVRWGVAVTATAALVLTTIFLLQQRGDDLQHPQMREIIADKGQRMHIRLSDGTSVLLNAESKLRLPQEFTSEARVVYLEGEAFFEVTSDPNAPFFVYAGDAVTQVLGTKFGVRAYPEDQAVQVVVVEGTVTLRTRTSSAHQEARITSHQRGVLRHDGQMIRFEVEDLSRYLGWTEGRLVFTETPLPAVLTTLERWYDIKCHLADSTVANRTLTASFQDEPLPEILAIVARALDLDYHRTDRVVVFETTRE